MKDTDGKITNENLLETVNNLSESKINSDIKIYNSVDTKASRIILFLGTIITLILKEELNIPYIVSSIFFTLSIAFSIAIIRPRNLKLGVDTYGLTEKYWNKNESKNNVLKDIVGNINDSTNSNQKLIKLKSKLLKRSLIMLSIGIGIIVTYTILNYFYILIISQCLKTIK